MEVFVSVKSRPSGDWRREGNRAGKDCGASTPNVSILTKQGEKTGQAKETEGKWVREFEIALLKAVESRTVKQTVTPLVVCFTYSL